MAKITDKQLNARAMDRDTWLSEVAIWGHGSLAARITLSGERLFYFRYQNSQGDRVNFPIPAIAVASSPASCPAKLPYCPANNA